MNDRKTVLKVGDYLYKQSLVSPNGTYALEHQADGTLVFRDNLASRDLWQIGLPTTEQTALRLMIGGPLALLTFTGVALWSSGRLDPMVDAALVRDDGRLVLVDGDGNQRWSRDPVDAALTSCSRPARGDRLRRGEVLVEPIVSPNGRYSFSMSTNGKCTLSALSDSPEGDRSVGSIWVGAPGSLLSLGQDGVLRAGTDSTVLQRWTGRVRLVATSVVVAELVVRDTGTVVLVDADGNEIDFSRTTAAEADLVEADRESALREVANNARPARPAGSGMAKGWFDSLGLSDFFTITWVKGVEGKEALSRLGAETDAITPMTYDEAIGHDEDVQEESSALAVPVGGWVALIEPHGYQGVYRAAELSVGTQVIVYHESMDGIHLAWHRNGETIAVYGEDDYFSLADGEPAPEGVDPNAFVPFMTQVGLGVYQEEEDEDDSEFLPPALEVACLAAGIAPEPEDFAGTHLGAVLAEQD